MRVRTGYSFGSVYGHLDEVHDLVRDSLFQHDYAPITDRASAFGWNKWRKECRGTDLRPVYGLELAVSPNYAAKDRAQDYWTFYARDDLQALHNLLLTATQQFKWEPVLSIQQAAMAEGVEIVTGGSMPLEHMAPLAGAPNLNVALSPSISDGALSALRQQGHKFVLSSDNYYPAIDDEKYYHLIAGKFSSAQTYPRHLMSDEALTLHMGGRGIEAEFTTSARARSVQVLEGCRAEMKSGKLLHPEGQRDLREVCVEAAKALGLFNDEVYIDRLDRELSLIEAKGFEDYFHIVGDMVRWARKEMDSTATTQRRKGPE